MLRIAKEWNQRALDKLIQDGIEESPFLEYKAAGSLEKSDPKKKEIAKDVSAMANAAGGTIIFGIQEYKDPAQKHLPERIDPIIRTDYPKEWLEHVVSNIEPRIDNLIIHPVPLDTGHDHVAYVIEIPKSTTAHQAQDLRYYMRYNFESVPMHDHQIRDVMARSQHPTIDVEIALQRDRGWLLQLLVLYHNSGNIYAEYVNGFLLIPTVLLREAPSSYDRVITIDGNEYKEVTFSNIHKDVVQVRPGSPGFPLPGGGSTGGGPPQPYYVTRYDPILPGLGRTFSVELGINEQDIEQYSDHVIRREIYADNAPKRTGEILLRELRLQ